MKNDKVWKNVNDMAEKMLSYASDKNFSEGQRGDFHQAAIMLYAFCDKLREEDK